MRFLIISYIQHHEKDNLYYAYEPYVREMNLWLKHVDELEVVAPISLQTKMGTDIAYQHPNIEFSAISALNFTTFFNVIKSVVKIPKVMIQIYKSCKRADHIHLRCPGNISLLGCMVQIAFPSKPKSVKYAGNWDPKAKQPLSYKFQKWLLSNTFLSKNIEVLVYGEWKGQSKNIKPFFTASFSDSEINMPLDRDYKNDLKFLFVGNLVEGKQPDVAIKIIEKLYSQGYKVTLDVYGDGALRQDLETYLSSKNISDIINFKGNVELSNVKQAMQKSHFLILPSKSEGWPKVIAEAMFFGTIPVSTNISCVPYMLDYGNRGILISDDIDEAVKTISKTIQDVDLNAMAKLASKWSQEYTLERFESEIIKILKI
ncbi:glycosyl transferase [Aquaticitalea lipolytica]|uniref:Glycosyl transferase n=1 Tax=Aquaticitalea lipolytica TaxID=1247562 RepID=A0A8J2TSK2_9FLAO|nr:glycosyltransferase [Aquaticitalea lipolytica]GFZ78012.1 glycosyl transferase [Aquaticitalea lipolytica]